MSDGTRQGTSCDVCGSTDEPGRGWIHPSGDVRPGGIEDGELRFKLRDGARSFCSLDCLDEFRHGGR